MAEVLCSKCHNKCKVKESTRELLCYKIIQYNKDDSRIISFNAIPYNRVMGYPDKDGYIEDHSGNKYTTQVVVKCNLCTEQK